MRIHTFLLGAGAALALTACADVKTTSGPPIAGTSTGPGSAPLKQDARGIAGADSANASGGTATVTGTRTTGRGGTVPEIDYSGTSTSPGVGSPVPVPTPPARSRSNKGG
jgi:hypothetical protein